MNILNEYDELRIGDVIGDTNRVVIASTKIQSRTPGDSYATFVAICHKEHDYHPYVVWIVTATSEGFKCSSGEYFANREYALRSYDRRGGK